MSTLKQTVWLTGATSGIGLALLDQLVKEGHKVIATARNAARLDELAARHPAQIIPMPGDTTRPDDMRRIETALTALGGLDWVILNAGTCEYMDIGHYDPEMVARVMETNVVGSARCVGAALPGLRTAQAQGRKPVLAVVSSSAWWFPFTRAEAYGASKAALTYFAHSLRADLAAENIRVAVISPGFVKTPLTDQNDFDMPFLISAEDAAQRILKGLKRGKADIHFPKRFTLTLKLLRLLPQCLINRMAASLSRNNKTNGSD